MKNASIFVIIGAKGGVGSTTITNDLAQSAHRQASTAIVDADLTGRRSLSVLLDAFHALNHAREDSAIASVQTSDGIELVELTPNIHGGFTLRMQAVEAFLTDLQERASLIFVDAPQPFAAAVRPFVTRASRFVLLFEPSVLGVTGARSTIEELLRFGIPQSRIMLIANHRDGKAEIALHDIKGALGVNIAFNIPQKANRSFAKAIEAIREDLLKSPKPENLSTLQPSISVPIGDRRDPSRRGSGPPSSHSSASGAQDERPRFAPQAVDSEAYRARAEMKAEVHAALADRLETLGANLNATDAERKAELATQVNEIVSEFLQTRMALSNAEEVAVIRREILDEALGYGPLEELMRDEAVSEIMVNGPKQIFVERAGKLTLATQTFADDRQLRLIIERMLAPIGRRIDESQPLVDGRLADGSRINAVISPLALDGASLTIRRFGKRRLTIEDLLKFGAICQPMVDFIKACVEARLNIVISGGTGSGKTTFLNVLSNFIPDGERIVTIEDAAELYLNQSHVVRLESRPANVEGKGEIRIRELVKNSLRMRPDRIVVGECRGGEALDMLQAMNTGHDGSITTAHSNSPRDTISRIETMVMMAGYDLPIRAIREQIASAVDVIIQISRLRDGSRKVVSVVEVVGMEGEVVTTQEIFSYKLQGLDEDGKVRGHFAFSGVQPNCIQKFEESGIDFDIRTMAKMGSETATW
jgi:pilus assembly protein CpaF